MIHKTLLNLSLAFSTLFIACGNGESQNSQSYLISGQLPEMANQELYLLDLSQPKAGPVDTAFVDESGNFGFDYSPSEIGFYRVNLNESMAMILPLKAGDEITVSGDVSNPNSLEVIGSPDVVRMTEFNRFLSKALEEQQQLNVKFQQYSDHPKQDSILKVFQKRYREIESDIEDKVKTMVDQDATLFSNLALMEQLTPDNADNISYFKKVEEALGDQYDQSPFYKNFKSKVTEAGRFAPGTEVPEINLPNPDGEKVPLSSLRGQVVLIDFWASWCKPCRRENPNVVEAYQKYKDKGFTVYGVSLDRTKEAWVKAIKDDNLSWTHVSDLKFWQSEAAQTYGVKGIPFALLIDEEGKVIGKNLRGQELHNKLAEVLN